MPAPSSGSCIALTWSNTMKGSHRPTAGLMRTMMFSTASAQMSVAATVITWALNNAPSPTPNVVVRPATTICRA